MQPSAVGHGATAIAVATDSSVTDAGCTVRPTTLNVPPFRRFTKQKRVKAERGQGADAKSPEHAQPSEFLQPVRFSPPRKETMSLLMTKELSHFQPAPCMLRADWKRSRQNRSSFSREPGHRPRSGGCATIA